MGTLDEQLDELPAAECRRLLRRLASEVPAVREVLTDWLLPARSDLLPRVAQLRHRLAGFIDWDEAGGVADEADHLMDRARSLPAPQQWEAASELAEALLENLDNVQDEGELYGAAERACALLVEAAATSRREGQTLERLLELDESPYGEIPWAAVDMLVEANPALGGRLEDWLLAAYAAMENEPASYRRSTLGRRLKDRYLETGREAEYLALLQADLGRPDTYLEWARFLESRGQRAEAVARAREGAEVHRGAVGEQALLDLLVEIDADPGWRERRFLLRPTAEDYAALRLASGYGFNESRPKLLEATRRQPALLATLLVMDEDRPALRELLAACPDVQVAERAAPFFPSEASTIFRRHSERVCEGRDRKAYRLAAQWAKKSKAISQPEEFGAWLVGFLARNRRYPALQEEFDALRT